MKRSTLTALLRIYDTGQDRVAVWYLDIFEEQQLVGLWERTEVASLTIQFVRSCGFEAFAVQLVPVTANATS